jgi:hypothetical protein
MESFNLDREIARLILLQRIEILNPFQKKIRKVLGRHFFTNIFSKYCVNSNKIGEKYLQEMRLEFNMLSKYLSFKNKRILSIGSGMCGLELIINSFSLGNFFTIIEKNYVSEKVKYGWDEKNLEAYNDIDKLNLFLQTNGMEKKNYEIYDFDKNNLPAVLFDYVISLYSLDYHYDFYLYKDYFKKILNKESILIFDTVRPDHFSKLFDKVKVINSIEKDTHSSKRIMCTGAKF